MTTKHQNGGQLLIDCLITLGARHSFGVPGESYLAVLDALHDTKGKLDFTLCRNEGGASFMAEAYGKLTGTPGICFVTRGPGATNASIGVHTAMQDSTPMILFIGQVGTNMKGREAFQEIDYSAYFGTVVKWVTEISAVERIPEILSRAWSTALSGRPGPVVIALPEDMLTSITEAKPCRPVRIPEPAPDQQTLCEIEEKLNGAKRPLIFIGGSGWKTDGTNAIQRFAEASDIPVVAAFRFQDLIDNHSPNYAGDLGVGMLASTKALIHEADVILAIGLRFGEMTTDGYTLLNCPNPSMTLIHAHASDREIGKVYAADIPVHSGPNTLSNALTTLKVSGDWSTWRANARDAYNKSFEAPVQPGDVDMVAITAHLRDVLPDDAVITNGAGNFTIWPSKFFHYGSNQRLLAPQSGAMGYGVPAAIAAKVAEPERTVVCFAGDGDFQMNCQELGTAMQAGAQPIILLLNNGIYGTIRMHQERNYPARVSGTDLVNPDFVGLAKSYGFHAETVTTTADFSDAFARALESNTGAVLELLTSAEALTPRQTLSQMREQALKQPKSGQDK